MTHEELLARIDDQDFSYDSLARSLMAVVELHKMDKTQECFDCSNKCMICGTYYPCAIIEVIEKQLND